MVDLEEPASLDTVGAVVVDQEGNVAAAVSSGGLAMKHPGRVGQVTITVFYMGLLVTFAVICEYVTYKAAELYFYFLNFFSFLFM